MYRHQVVEYEPYKGFSRCPLSDQLARETKTEFRRRPYKRNLPTDLFLSLPCRRSPSKLQQLMGIVMVLSAVVFTNIRLKLRRSVSPTS